MVKKFKEWRDNVTLSQTYKIMWIVGIIIGTIITLSIILNWEQLTKNLEDQMPIWMYGLILLIAWLGTVELGIWFVLDGDGKETNLEREKTEKKISPNLKEDEFTEIYLKQRLRRNVRNVSKIILDGYDTHEKRYFAKKEEAGVYVIMKEEETIIKDYHIRNYLFFDYHFTFSKEEQ